MMLKHTYFKGLALRFREVSLHSCPQGSEGVFLFTMSLKANEVTWLRRTVLPQGSQGPDGASPPAPLHVGRGRGGGGHRPELRPATARGDFWDSRRRQWPAGDRACAPASVEAAHRSTLTPYSGAVRCASSRGGRSHPRARAPCQPRRPPCAGALRGGVTAPPVGLARRWRAATAAVAAAAPLSSPHAPPAAATWLYVPPFALAAIGPAGVPGGDALPSAPSPSRPGNRTHVPGITGLHQNRLHALLRPKWAA